MSDLHFLYPIPPKIGKILLKMVEIAEGGNILILSFIKTNNASASADVDYQVRGGNIEKQLEGMPDYAMETLDHLGFIHLKDRNVFLTDIAFSWARYQRKNRLKKWCHRARYKPIPPIVTLFVSVTLSILSTLLLVLRILEALPLLVLRILEALP